MQPDYPYHCPPKHPAQAALDARATAMMAKGARVTGYGNGWIQLETGKPYQRLKHAALILCTLGLWLPVALCIRIFGGVRRVLLSGNPDGSVSVIRNRA
jgi:hypothetical protein